MKKISYSVALLCSVLVLYSCDKSEDPVTPPVEPAVADLYGDYVGKMLIKPGITPISDEAEGVDIEAKAKTDTVYFDKLPIDDLVISIVGNENAAEIITALGDVSYKVGYEAKLSSNNDSILMTCTPKPLELYIPGVEVGSTGLNVVITISEGGKASYAYKDKLLKLGLNAEAVTLNGEPLKSFAPIALSFGMNKK